MTPYEIKILLHYYTHGGDHPDIKLSPPIWTETIAKFYRQGLMMPMPESEKCITDFPMTHKLTDRGGTYCDALQQVPLPTWVVRWPEQDGRE